MFDWFKYWKGSDRCLDLSNLYLRQKYCHVMLEANLKENFDCVNALLGTSYFSGKTKHKYI